MAFDKKIHTVVETTNLQATNWGRHIHSVVAEQDLDNGAFGFLGDCVEGTNDTYKLLKPNDELIKTAKPVMVAHVDAAGISQHAEAFAMDEQNYYNEAGKTVRAYELEATGKFTMTSAGIDTIKPQDGVAVGNYVVLQDGKHKLKEVAAPPADVSFLGKIEKIDHYAVHLLPNYIKDEDNNLVINRPQKVTIKIIKNDI